MTQLSINTTQNVNINFTAASIGERIVSFLVDILIQIAYLIVIFWVLYSILEDFNGFRRLDDFSRGAVMIIFCLPAMFYTLLFESIFEGQSLGKRLMRIKVVKIDGYQASFGDYLIRWLFRLVDVFMLFGLIGLIGIVTSKKSQRLGDMTAGTAVISLKNSVTINSTILEDIDEQYIPIYPQVIKLSDNDIRIIKENLAIALKAHDYKILERLKDKIEAVTGIKNQSGNVHDFIKTILKDYNYYTQNM